MPDEREILLVRKELPSDELAKDLVDFVTDNVGAPEDYKPLLEALMRYVAERDIKIWDHAYKLGKESK